MATKDYWIYNHSKSNVSLGDLGLTIPARTNVNLGDNKHYKLTDEQIEKSIKNGSVSKKQHLLVVRKSAPEKIKKVKPCNYEPTSFKRKIIGEVYEGKKYDELLLSDEDFANDTTTNTEDDMSKAESNDQDKDK